jgi:hypothetical protein
LSRQIEFAGKSGARYRYTTLDEDRFLPPAGANFVIAQATSDGLTIVFAGETDNLSARVWRDRLEEARTLYGHVEVLTRLNVKSAVRREEQTDMIEQYQPPMNGESGGIAVSAHAPQNDRAAS